MGGTLTLSILEIILLFFGAIILGITIHFTIASRRNLKASMKEREDENKLKDEWKLRYFNDIELRDKELASLKDQLSDAEENANIYSIEAEEMRKENKKLLAELNSIPKIVEPSPEQEKESHQLIEEWKSRYFKDIEVKDKELSLLKEQLVKAEESTNIYSIEAEELRKENKKLLAEKDSIPKMMQPAPEKEKPDYLDQLRMAQSSLLEHNEKINQLIENIEAFKEKEEKQREIMKKNDELELQISELQQKIVDRDREINSIRQKELLTKEMTSMLDNAYSEFNVLQSKMQKLEMQVSSSKLINLEYEDLQESYRKLSRDFEEQKMKLSSIVSDNQQLQAQLMETEEKLREANFHRQQMQKRVTYLEELNNDLQSVSDANKKLEFQLKRIGELESKLNMTAEERDQLQRRRFEKK